MGHGYITYYPHPNDRLKHDVDAIHGGESVDMASKDNTIY